MERVEDLRKILSAYIVELGHIGLPNRFGPAVTWGIHGSLAFPQVAAWWPLEKNVLQQFHTFC